VALVSQPSFYPGCFFLLRSVLLVPFLLLRSDAVLRPSLPPVVVERSSSPLSRPFSGPSH